MPTITVRSEDGETVERNIVSRSASIVPDDGEELSPAIVQRIEYDHKGTTSSITTECGETENRREADEKPDMTVEGILVEEQIETAKQLKQGDQITLVSDIHQGEVFVRRLTIEQNTDIITFQQSGEEQLAFPFQLQLKQPE